MGKDYVLLVWARNFVKHQSKTLESITKYLKCYIRFLTQLTWLGCCEIHLSGLLTRKSCNWRGLHIHEMHVLPPLPPPPYLGDFNACKALRVGLGTLLAIIAIITLYY